jgi:mono/diheme cytochrome c family protein
MSIRMFATAGVALLLAGILHDSSVAAPDAATPAGDVDRQFTDVVKPFMQSYCVSCHGGEKPEAHFDLSKVGTMADVTADHPHWQLVREKLLAKQMPPKDAVDFPSDQARQRVIDWVKAMRTSEARKNAGDAGIVLARRLSNAEYNYSIRDLTGQDLQPAKEFPVDPANPMGFDNTGESLQMSPELMNKYLLAAREVANHMVLGVDGRLVFAPHPMLVETDRDKYCINQIIDFYHRQDTDYADYFASAWKFKHRAQLGKPQATLEQIAAEDKVSAKYLATVWQLLEGSDDEVGPIAKLRTMWRALPDGSRQGVEQMRDYVVGLRAKVEMRFQNLSAGRIGASSQPFLMWKNKQYATHRRTWDHGQLQVQGETRRAKESAPAPTSEPGADNEFGPGKTQVVKNKTGDPDLLVPAGQRAQYEAAFDKFCDVFPDAFYISERGRNYLDKSKDKGRLLSAGFHNLMGYFRDDQPLCELILDEQGRKQLDQMWQEMDFIASANVRTYVQFYFNESGEARGVSRESEGPRPADKDVTSEDMINQVRDAYLTKAQASKNPVAIKAVEEHFKWVNDGVRWVEHARLEAEPKHVESLLQFAASAYRRPLTKTESDELVAFYRSLRKESGLEHEEAMRDAVVSVLMSPDFCYRIDLVDQGPTVRPLSDYALASRLSYFLWSSMPDDELLKHAAAGDLHQPNVLAAQAKRMLKDARVCDLAVEFGGNWLDFRRFEELNTVDRERFTSFDNDLRESMFQEPIRFMLDVFQNNRSILDFIYGNHTFVNSALAKHYGMPDVNGGADQWVRVDHAEKFGRGGILPMAAFLTKNAPGLRTSPVKRGYWIVKRVLGEQIPPPPAMVPELPRDEAKMDLPLRDMMARHRADASCAACHQRFDAMGLVFEGYGPVGERREKDLAGRAVDPRATFPGGSEGSGFDGLRTYIREHRQDDFVDNLSQKLLAYAIGRSLQLSDDITIDELHSKLAADGYRFDTLIEGIVTSPQFLNKRGRDNVAQR